MIAYDPTDQEREEIAAEIELAKQEWYGEAMLAQEEYYPIDFDDMEAI